MMFKALSTLVLAASLLGATVASPTNSDLEAGLQARQSCSGNNGVCGSGLAACCSGLFCNTLNGRCGPCMTLNGACTIGVPCCAGFTCSALSGDRQKNKRAYTWNWNYRSFHLPSLLSFAHPSGSSSLAVNCCVEKYAIVTFKGLELCSGICYVAVKMPAITGRGIANTLVAFILFWTRGSCDLDNSLKPPIETSMSITDVRSLTVTHKKFHKTQVFVPAARYATARSPQVVYYGIERNTSIQLTKHAKENAAVINPR
ncbi:hypothetical protein C8R45DRAFT_940578 [Mycena sanguinolenta]|nr:hypothetical protein C8R45DRAFT_940578 [Mycena sanguinolenta]